MKKNTTLSIFLIIITITTACSSKTDKEMYEAAEQYKQDENFTEAVAEFESLINDFPESQFIPRAYFEIGMIYQGQLVKNIGPTESFEMAIKNYRAIFERFPDNPDAPNSLFMVGFIQANELNQLDSAKSTYNLFIKKYPNHELKASAQAEIENLGLAPEEILKKKMSSTKK
ncbi:MAG: hypothetical protein A2V66_07875 [Ignavibacteria bacterium RBG_13_36_8]|nr:MAG: hypothetical protein A2V66_07875 [Ignavibacteria bacterium RBG_13_36_8]